MRIALRTSGGRGEYELAGTHAGITTADLFDKQLVVELTPGVKLYTNNFLRNTQGKRRIRLIDERTDKHIYRLLAAALLLPKPKRQLSETGFGHLQLIDDKFSITDIEFDVAQVLNNEVVIRPTYVRLSNTDSSKILDVAQRMKYILNLWAKAEEDVNNEIPTVLLNAHQRAYYTAKPIDIFETASLIRRIIDSDEDPLRQLLRIYGLNDISTSDMAISSNIIIEFPDNNDKPIIQSTNEIIRKWRYIAYRGMGGERFRQNVNQAYNYKCLFTGYHLPKLPLTDSTGVDAAHILPWASHGINEVQNGICLNKLCHWAFDAGLLKLDFDVEQRNCLSPLNSWT
ncbi:hypothetical protein GCM10023187_47580 [Nibrella viscosa]|uniref:HNH nuclease domain-containing protein n=1 Tax=Nibrella viscosa TaxID=1084524 RepID=A0ABP8KU26_9BACT